MPSLVETMARWIVSLKRSQIPDIVMDETRLQVMSQLAAVHAGSRSPAGEACRQASLMGSGPGEATVLPTGERAPVSTAILGNASQSMVHDYDDYLFLGHPGHSSFLTSLAVAEQTGATLEQMLVAQVAANEIAGRLGAYVAVGPANGQLWAHIHLAAAVAAAARLAGLSREHTAHALAIALSMPPRPLRPAFFGTDAKVMTAALPALTGVHAVHMARAGLAGPLRILEQERGLGDTFSFLPLPQVLGGLGESWVSSSMSCKTHPGCAYVSGPVAAALEATGAEALEPARIRNVDVQVTALTTTMERLCEANAPDPMDPVAVSFSARRCVAIGLLEGSVTPVHLDPAWLDEHRYQIQSVASRTSISENRPMTLEMLHGMGRGVDLPLLLKEVGLTRFWKMRGPLKEAFAEGLGQSSAPRRRSLKDLSPWSRAPRGDTFTLLGDMVKRAASGGRFDMADADFTALEFRFSATVTVTLDGGKKLEATVRIPPGAAGRPFDERRRHVQEKLRSCFALGDHDDSAEEVIRILDEDPSSCPASDLARAACP